MNVRESVILGLIKPAPDTNPGGSHLFHKDGGDCGLEPAIKLCRNGIIAVIADLIRNLLYINFVKLAQICNIFKEDCGSEPAMTMHKPLLFISHGAGSATGHLKNSAAGETENPARDLSDNMVKYIIINSDQIPVKSQCHELKRCTSVNIETVSVAK